VCRSQNMVYKRRREEPVPESDDDSELDEDEKEALEAFKNEGFNKDIEDKEAKRLKKVEDELDAQEREKERAENEEIERQKKQKIAAESAANAPPPQAGRVVPAPPESFGDLEGGGPPEDWIDHPNYKTKLCVRWQTGGCSFGERCGFAHGGHDMRVRKAPDIPLPPAAQVNVVTQPQYADMAQQMAHQSALHAQHMAQQHMAHQFAQGHAQAQYMQHHQMVPQMAPHRPPAVPAYGYQQAPPVPYQQPVYNAVPQMQHRVMNSHLPGQHMQMPTTRTMQMPPARPNQSHSVPLPSGPPPPLPSHSHSVPLPSGPPPPPPPPPSHR